MSNDVEQPNVDEIESATSIAMEKAMKEMARNLNPELERRISELESTNHLLASQKDAISKEYLAMKKERDIYRGRVNKPLRQAWLGEALETLGDNLVVYHPGLQVDDWPDKCPKCNDDRQIVFTSPQGYEHKESCDTCGSRKILYVPMRLTLKRFDVDTGKQNEDGTYNTIFTFQSIGNIDHRYEQRTIIKALPENMRDIFECDQYDADVLYGDSLFATEELCQKVCDWINKEEDYPKMQRKLSW